MSRCVQTTQLPGAKGRNEAVHALLQSAGRHPRPGREHQQHGDALLGTSNGPTGYTKNYVYDDRLKYRSPPYFLDPVQASWKVNRINEQVPAIR